MVDYQVMPKNIWETLPVPAKAPDEWSPVLDLLEGGEVVSFPLPEEHKRKGQRLGLGRRAAGRGFKVEFRSDDGHLYARRSDSPYVAPNAQGQETEPKKRGRPRKQA